MPHSKLLHITLCSLPSCPHYKANAPKATSPIIPAIAVALGALFPDAVAGAAEADEAPVDWDAAPLLLPDAAVDAEAADPVPEVDAILPVKLVALPVGVAVFAFRVLLGAPRVTCERYEVDEAVATELSM